jgi:hypothetical protein
MKRFKSGDLVVCTEDNAYGIFVRYKENHKHACVVLFLDCMQEQSLLDLYLEAVCTP